LKANKLKCNDNKRLGSYHTAQRQAFPSANCPRNSYYTLPYSRPLWIWAEIYRDGGNPTMPPTAHVRV